MRADPGDSLAQGQHSDPDERRGGRPEEERGPEEVLLARRVHRDVVAAERDERQRRPADACGESRRLRAPLPRRRHDPAEGQDEAELLDRARVVAGRESPRDGDRSRSPGDRGDDRDRACSHPAVEGDEAGGAEDRGEARPEDGEAGRPLAVNRDGHGDRGEPDRLRAGEHGERR